MKENKLVEYSIIFIALVILVIVLQSLSSILRPLAIAFFITMLVIPVYEFSKRKKIPVALPITGVFIIIIIAFYFLGGLLSSEVTRFDENKEAYNEQINETISLLTQNSNTEFESFNIQTIMQSQAGNRFISTSVSTISSVFSEIFLAILFAIFIIPGYKRLIQTVNKHNKNLQETMIKIQKHVISYLGTKTIISLGTAISSALILTIFQSDFIWTLSIIIFLFNFIPNIGSIVAVLIAAALYALKFGIGTKFFAVLILLGIMQQVWGNIIEPKFAGRQLKISPLLIIISLFFWGWVWGVGGMLISVPLLTTTKIILEHFDSTKHIAAYMQ